MEELFRITKNYLQNRGLQRMFTSGLSVLDKRMGLNAKAEYPEFNSQRRETFPNDLWPKQH